LNEQDMWVGSWDSAQGSLCVHVNDSSAFMKYWYFSYKRSDPWLLKHSDRRSCRHGDMVTTSRDTLQSLSPWTDSEHLRYYRISLPEDVRRETKESAPQSVPSDEAIGVFFCRAQMSAVAKMLKFVSWSYQRSRAFALVPRVKAVPV
jgi:hypothetical protein